MAVPDYQTLMLPLLKALAEGEARRLVPDVTDEVAEQFDLTEEDLDQQRRITGRPAMRCRSCSGGPSLCRQRERAVTQPCAGRDAELA
jgi:hypothetical protein